MSTCLRQFSSFPQTAKYRLAEKLAPLYRHAMRQGVATVAFILSIFALAAAVAPVIYFLMQWVGTFSPRLASIADSPFHRYVNRCLLLFALIGLWPFLWTAGVRSWRQLGLGDPRGHVREAFAGFLIGFASLAIAALLNLAFGGRAWDHEVSIGAFVASVFRAAIAALLVAVIEEIFFRGALFGTLRRDLPWIHALVISSFVYAILHFFRRPDPPDAITWTSGFTTLIEMMRGFGDGNELAPGLINLALAGIILGFAYQRTGSLYFSIGLHAGWVFWMKLYGAITESNTAASWFWGSRRLVDGWASSFVLLGVLLVLSIRSSFSALDSKSSRSPT